MLSFQFRAIPAFLAIFYVAFLGVPAQAGLLMALAIYGYYALSQLAAIDHPPWEKVLHGVYLAVALALVVSDPAFREADVPNMAMVGLTMAMTGLPRAYLYATHLWRNKLSQKKEEDSANGSGPGTPEDQAEQLPSSLAKNPESKDDRDGDLEKKTTSK